MDASSLRNFRDFLQLYNQMTEKCFYRCIEETNSRQLGTSEIECVDKCAMKFIKFNNKLMMNFVKTQTELVNRRVKDAEQQLANSLQTAPATSTAQVSVSTS